MIGQTLGHYRVLEQIGAGGMGLVFRAHDERLDRDVALKVLPPGTLTDENARKRFRKEALTLSKLNHPNIETVFDFDTQEGTDFLVMELIPGVTLDEKLKVGALPEREVVHLGMQLAEGLAAAHAEGVIHRDLKPGNLRLAPDGRLKILDFGLAKLLRPVSDVAATESLSKTHGAVGTLPYMAPEQVQGEGADARSDLWAAGAVLYELATGRRPFLAQGLAVTDQILHQVAEAPSSVNPRISPALDAVVVKCLDKDPDNRYQSAKEMAVDLRRLQMGVATGPQPAVKSTRRATAKVVGVGLGMLASVIVLLVAFNVGGWRDRLLGRGEAPRIASLAVLPLENLSGDPQQEYFADGMTESLITDLGQLTGLKRVIARRSVMRFKGTKKTLTEIARELKVDALITGTVLRSGDRVRVTAQLINPDNGEQLWTGHYERDTGEVLRLQSEVTTAIVGELRVKLQANEQARLASFRSVNPEAYDAYLMGRFHMYKLTPQGFDKALEYFQLALDKDPNYAPAYVGIGNIWALREHLGWVPAGEGWAKAKSIVARVLETDSTSAEAHELLASYLAWHEWQWNAGLKEYERAIELNPNYATARFFYSLTLYAMRRPEEALRQMERATELDPYNPLFHEYYASELINFGRPEEGLVQLQKAADLSPDSPTIHVFRWQALEQKGEYQQALSEAKQYYTMIEKPAMAEALERDYARGGYSGAMRRLADTLAASGRNILQAASLYAVAGEDDLALDWLQKAYERRLGPLPYVNVQKRWDRLRSHPRFQELLRRMNLPQ